MEGRSDGQLIDSTRQPAVPSSSTPCHQLAHAQRYLPVIWGKNKEDLALKAICSALPPPRSTVCEEPRAPASHTSVFSSPYMDTVHSETEKLILVPWLTSEPVPAPAQTSSGPVLGSGALAGLLYSPCQPQTWSPSPAVPSLERRGVGNGNLPSQNPGTGRTSTQGWVTKWAVDDMPACQDVYPSPCSQFLLISVCRLHSVHSKIRE